MRELKPSLFRRFARDRRAASAVEFALSLPFLLVIYLGGIELAQAISADRKVTLLARTITDLVAQSSNVSSDDVTSIFNVSTAVLYPLPVNAGGVENLKMKVSEVWTDAKKVSKFDWSKAQNTAADTGGDLAKIPDPQASTATVVATVSYRYTPVLAAGIIGPLTLTKTIYMRPRLSECVSLDKGMCGSAAAAAYGS